MKKETTRRQFLCDAGPILLLGAYGCWKGGPEDSEKKAEICSKDLPRYKITDGEKERIFQETEPLLADIGLTTFVKITAVHIFEDCGPQIWVDCKAMDSFDIYDIHADFFPDTREERDRILRDLKVGSVFMMKGGYNISKDSSVMLYDPAYSRVEPEVLEDKMKRLFEIEEDWAKIPIRCGVESI